jgi:hypothetical protein
VREKPGVHRHLAACGFLKLFDCPLIRSQEFLIQYFIGMWRTNLHFFIVRGEANIICYKGCVFIEGTPLPWEVNSRRSASSWGGSSGDHGGSPLY